LVVRLLDVIALHRNARERSDTVFMPRRGKKCDARIPFRRAQLNPALSRSHRLIGHQGKPKTIDVELQCAVLIANRNTRELDLANHGCPFLVLTRCGNELLTIYKRFASEERNADAIGASRVSNDYIGQYYTNA